MGFSSPRTTRSARACGRAARGPADAAHRCSRLEGRPHDPAWWPDASRRGRVRDEDADQPPALVVEDMPGSATSAAGWRSRRTSGTSVTNFKRSTVLDNTAMRYNRGLDRDKDGIACEKR